MLFAAPDRVIRRRQDLSEEDVGPDFGSMIELDQTLPPWGQCYLQVRLNALLCKAYPSTTENEVGPVDRHEGQSPSPNDLQLPMGDE